MTTVQWLTTQLREREGRLRQREEELQQKDTQIQRKAADISRLQGEIQRLQVGIKIIMSAMILDHNYANFLGIRQYEIFMQCFLIGVFAEGNTAFWY